MEKLKQNSIERLQQEHAIYKEFFLQMKNRPHNPVQFHDYWKARLFEVLERIEKLDGGIAYFDPSWSDAKTVLFIIDIDENHTNA